jgi:hypothetical protein
MPEGDWSGARTTFYDEFGNRGEVRWPRMHSYGTAVRHSKWEDASVHLSTRVEDGADEVATVAEFLHELAHVAKTLDLAFAEDKAKAMFAIERNEEERQQAEKVRQQAVQRRCDEIAQFYMQLVRVQREGHASMAKGELLVTTVKDDDGNVERVQPRMWLKESNGNRWDFRANQVSKFEVKNGQRYEEVRLTPMEDLEAEARKMVTA